MLAIYRRYHKSVLPGGNTSRNMLGRLRQVVGRERERRAGEVPAIVVDKTDDSYVDKLQRVRESTAAVRGGCATEEQARTVCLHHQTKKQYADLAAYCRVNEKFDKDQYSFFVPDLYKTGWEAYSS